MSLKRSFIPQIEQRRSEQYFCRFQVVQVKEYNLLRGSRIYIEDGSLKNKLYVASRSTHGVIPPTKYNPSILKFALTTTYTTNWWTISLKFHGQVFQKNIFKNPQKTIKQTVNKQTWNDVSCFAFVSVR